MRIWIDLANSPHVLFFAPVVAELERRGHEVALSARAFAQTEALARLRGIEAEVIGEHGGSSVLGKGRAILSRAGALRSVGKRFRPDLAVSHNSYAHALAARSLGVPYVTLMDYEHTPANHVSFRLARRILLPEALRSASVRRYGAVKRKVVFYEGFKEQVYLDGFVPDRSRIADALPDGIFDRHVVAVARPPADFALYHRFENPLFEEWLVRAAASSANRILVLPRTDAQRSRIAALGLPGVLVPEETLDGPNLLHHADLVVSAGGTMNREAAVLGVPAYSLFRGRAAAVDDALASIGRLVRIGSRDELDRIAFVRKAPPVRLRNPALLARLVDGILEGATLLS